MVQHDMPPSLTTRLIDVKALKHVDVRDGISLQLLSHETGESAIRAINSDPEIWQHVYVASLIHTIDDVDTQVADMMRDGNLLRYVVVERDDVIGMVNFWRAGDFFGELVAPDACGVGYFLVPSARGKGILADALVRLLETAENAIDVHEFVAFCEDENSASRAVLKRAGFSETKTTIDFSKLGAVERKYVRNGGVLLPGETKAELEMMKVREVAILKDVKERL